MNLCNVYIVLQNLRVANLIFSKDHITVAMMDDLNLLSRAQPCPESQEDHR